MVTLTIRNVPEEIRDKLRIRAARNGRSMEAEARDVLRRAAAEQTPSIELTPEQRLAPVRELIRKRVPAGVSLVDEFLAQRRAMWGDD